MMSNLQTKFERYPAYKDSGVEWIGEIPTGWEVRRLKYVAQMIASNVDKHIKPLEKEVKLCNYVDVYKNDSISEECNFMIATANDDEINKFKIRIDDVIITKDSEDWLDIGVPSLVKFEDENLICGYHLAILRPKPEVTGDYLYRALLTSKSKTQFSVSASGVTRFGISHRTIKSAWIILPPLSEQTAIANFLDEKTAKIDIAIAQKEKLIDLLKTRKQIIIQNAVTKGLDATVAFKDSGVDWIGEIPAHWEVRRLAVIGRFSKGGGFSKSDLTDEGQIAILYGDIYTKYEFSIKKGERKISTETSMKSVEIKQGDLLLTGSGETIEDIGKCVVYDNEKVAFAGGDIIIFKQTENNSLYLSYFLNTAGVKDEKAKTAKGEIIVHTYASKLKNLYATIPPTVEQGAIVTHIKTQSAKIDQAISLQQKQIEKLKVYKATLINSAVTGKIKIE